MRYPNGIEIYVNKDKLTTVQFNYLRDTENIDFEYNKAKDKWTVWIHDDGNFQITHETLNYLLTLLAAYLGTYNNETGTDHLNIYTQTNEEIDQYGISIDADLEKINYKNLNATGLIESLQNKEEIKFKRELSTLIN